MCIRSGARCICEFGASDGSRAWRSFPLGALYRSAPLMAFALRQLGATVGRNLQCAHNAVAVRAPRLDLHRGQCRHLDRGLHPYHEVVRTAPARRPCSPRERLQNRNAGCRLQQRDGGPRRMDHAVHPDPRRRGRAGDVGGESCAPHRPLHGAQAHRERLSLHPSDLAAGNPEHPHAGLRILFAQCDPHRRDLVVRRRTSCPREKLGFPTHISG